MTYLDTHVVVFLFNRQLHKLSSSASRQVNSDDLVNSPMVILELEMMREKDPRIPRSQVVVSELAQSIGLSVCQLPMATIVQHSIPLGWTRDPGDRMIVGNAIAANESPLISKDALIGKFYKNAIW